MSAPPVLSELLDALRVRGFAIGVDDHVRVARIASMDADWSMRKLRHALRAILATDPGSRAEFDQVFDSVFAGHAPPALTPARMADPASGPVRETRAAVTRTRRGLALAWLAVAGIPLVAAALAWMYAASSPIVPARQTSNSSVGDATAISPSGGPYGLDLSGIDSTYQTETPHSIDQQHTQAGPQQSGTSSYALEGSSKPPSKGPSKPSGDPSPHGQAYQTGSTGDRDPRTRQTPGATPNSDSYTDPNAAVTADSIVGPDIGSELGHNIAHDINAGASGRNTSDIALAPVFMWALCAGGLAALIAGLLFGWRVRVRRRAFVPGPWRYRRTVPRDRLGHLLSEQTIEDSAHALTWSSRASEGQVLDVHATVARTVAAAGFPQPVFQPPPPAPEYAILVDASPDARPWRSLYDELFDRLEVQGVRLRRYTYEGSPAVCAAVGREVEETLAEIAEHTDAVIAVGDARMGKDPFNRRPPAWVAALQQFPVRLWLNPLPESRWTAGAREVARSTPMVHGAGGVLGALQPGGDRHTGPGLPATGSAYPAVIELAPDSDVAVDALRSHLGEHGFRLLQWLAIAGPPDADTARFLAHRMGLELPEDDFLRLATLPVCAHRRWPEGLRSRLVSRLRASAPEDEPRVRECALEQLRDSEPEPGSLAHLHWQLDHAAFRAQSGQSVGAQLSALTLSPIHADASAVQRQFRVRDRVAGVLYAFVVMGVVALVAGGLLARQLRERERAARVARELREDVRALGDRLRDVDGCLRGADSAIADLRVALAVRVATEPESRLGFDRCLSIASTLRDIARHPDHPDWRASQQSLESALSRMSELVSLNTPLDSYRQLADLSAEMIAAHAEHRRSLGVEPWVDDVRTQVVPGSPEPSSPLTALDGTTLALRSAARDGDVLIVEGAAAGGDHIALMYGPDAIDRYRQAPRVVRALGRANWGVEWFPGGPITAGQLDGRGRVGAGIRVFEETAPGEGVASPPVDEARTPEPTDDAPEPESDGAPLRRTLMPRFALGRDNARMVVAQRPESGDFSVAQSLDKGRSWRGLRDIPGADPDLQSGYMWHVERASGRAWAVRGDTTGLSYYVYDERDPGVWTGEPAFYEAADLSPVRTGCMACTTLWSIHERASYHIRLRDGQVSRVNVETGDSGARAACTDTRLLVLEAGGADALEARVCSPDGTCELVAELPARLHADPIALAVFEELGEVIAYVDQGILILWTRAPGATKLQARPVFHVPAGVWVAAVQVFDGRLYTLVSDQRQAWLIDTGAVRPVSGGEFASVPELRAHQAVLDAAERQDMAAMAAAYRELSPAGGLACRVRPVYERARDRYTLTVLDRAQGKDGALSCVARDQVIREVSAIFPDMATTLDEVACQCPGPEQCNALENPPPCCDEWFRTRKGKKSRVPEFLDKSMPVKSQSNENQLAPNKPEPEPQRKSNSKSRRRKSDKRIQRVEQPEYNAPEVRDQSRKSGASRARREEWRIPGVFDR